MPTPDAILLPPHYGKGPNNQAKLQSIDAEFRKILDVPKLYIRLQGQGAGTFITGHWGCTLNFPKDSNRPDEPRYVWTDRGDGVMFGVLKPDPPVEEGKAGA